MTNLLQEKYEAAIPEVEHTIMHSTNGPTGRLDKTHLPSTFYCFICIYNSAESRTTTSISFFTIKITHSSRRAVQDYSTVRVHLKPCHARDPAVAAAVMGAHFSLQEHSLKGIQPINSATLDGNTIQKIRPAKATWMARRPILKNSLYQKLFKKAFIQCVLSDDSATHPQLLIHPHPHHHLLKALASYAAQWGQF